MPKRRMDPLPGAAFQILLSLAGEDLHGYGMMRQVEAQTEGRVRLGPGTLYTSIQGLLEEGFIEELETMSEGGSGSERRRVYRLTTTGRAVAQLEAERMATTLRVARARKIFGGAHV